MHNNEDFFHQIVGSKELDNIVDMLISLIDLSTFKYSTRNDIINVFDIISAISCKTVIKTIRQPANKSIFIDEFKRQLMIIQTGILVEK